MGLYIKNIRLIHNKILFYWKNNFVDIYIIDGAYKSLGVIMNVT
jgi:hypothetical protein